MKTIRLAVKFPVTNDILTAIFQPTITCVKENAFYMTIVPALFQFQRECGINENNLIDIFIQCYGARNSLDTSKNEWNFIWFSWQWIFYSISISHSNLIRF